MVVTKLHHSESEKDLSSAIEMPNAPRNIVVTVTINIYWKLLVFKNLLVLFLSLYTKTINLNNFANFNTPVNLNILNDWNIELKGIIEIKSTLLFLINIILFSL